MSSFTDVLQIHSRSVEELLAREIPKDAYPYLSEGVWYQFEGGGKRLRPALCLLTCEVLCGEAERALPFALATEIFHNYLLIHDDIEDGDTMRRDRPTLWAAHGIPNALNVGDFLIARVFQLVLKTPVDPPVMLALARNFCETFERTVEGQALDINLRGSPDASLARYFEIVQLKTAYYLALPWVGGALIGGLPERDLEPLRELGRCLGPAFQIRDDVLDLTEGKGRGGEIGCDLKEGKPSIFFSYVCDSSSGTDRERERLRAILRVPREQTSPQDIAWAIDFYRRCGALEFAEKEAARLIERAENTIDTLPLPAAGKDLFRNVSRYIVDRRT